MFDKLKKHHCGFIVKLKDKESLEKKYNKQFIYDEIQKTHVLFIFEPELNIYIELICQEGRVAKQPCGFAHICYQVKNTTELEQVETYIKENKLGYGLTKLEKSASDECGSVIFYYIKNMGVIELNCAESLECLQQQSKI